MHQTLPVLAMFAVLCTLVACIADVRAARPELSARTTTLALISALLFLSALIFR